MIPFLLCPTHHTEASAGDCEAHTASLEVEEVEGAPSPKTTAKAKRKRYTMNTVR